MTRKTKGILCKECRRKMSQIRIKKGIKNPFFDKAYNWKGGRIDRGGYVYIKTLNHPLGGKQGYVAEHRLVMEKFLGRFLTRKEVVHHVNGDKRDNRIKNLELFASAGQHTSKAHPEVFEKCKALFKGKRHSPRTEFKKGMIPWNKRKFV